MKKGFRAQAIAGLWGAVIGVLLLAVSPLAAREIHVRGSFDNAPPTWEPDGTLERPFPTITAAAAVAEPGDTVRVDPIKEGYRETVDLSGLKGGEPGRPITIDGQGAELIGSDPVSAEGWSYDKERGLYHRGDLQPKLFLVVDGAMRFPADVAPEALQAGEWTARSGELYLKLADGVSPRDVPVEVATRINGVQIRGETANLVIRNFNARHFINDGYNIHDRAHGLEFYNCNARDMGDEGFSSHGSAETLLDGATFINCENGIFNANTGGKCVVRNVVVRDPRKVGFGQSPRDGSSPHLLENAIIINAPSALRIGKGSKADNVLILSDRPSTAILMDYGGELSRVAVSGEGTLGLRIGHPGSFNLQSVTFNTGRLLNRRDAGKLPGEGTITEVAIAEGLSLPGSEVQTFPRMPTRQLLERLIRAEQPGPSAELAEKALLLIGEEP